jgi:hypothetical protein
MSSSNEETDEKKQRHKEAIYRWREKNKEMYNSLQREYNKKHREEGESYKKTKQRTNLIYYERNKEDLLEKRRVYYS